MNDVEAANARAISTNETTGARGVSTGAARFTRQVVSWPLLALLTLLEPIVRAVLSLAMMLGILATIVFELSAAGPQFEFLRMLALSLGFGVALILYYGLLALVSR